MEDCHVYKYKDTEYTDMWQEILRLPVFDEDCTSLHRAVLRGQHEEMQRLLQLGVDVDISVPQNWTPLHVAVWRSDPVATEILLRHGADPNRKASISWNNRRVRPMLFAVSSGCTRTVRLLASHGADVNALVKISKNEYTYLHHAVNMNDVEMVKTLLQCRVDPNLSDKLNCTPLYLACFHGYLEITSTLLRHGAWVHNEANQTNSPLFVEIFRNNEHIFEQLIRFADLDERNSLGETALHVAVSAHKHDKALVLLESGADPNARCARGRTALHCAALQSNHLVVKWLLEFGARPDALDAAGRAPLHWAVHDDERELAAELLLYGASPQARDAEGRTALELALRCRSERCLETLLLAGPAPSDFYAELRLLVRLLGPEALRGLAGYFLKREVAGLPVRPEHVELGRLLWPDAGSFARECARELERMRSRRMSGHIRVYDFLTATRRQLVHFLGHLDVRSVFRENRHEIEFPLYKDILGWNALIGRRYEYFDAAVEALRSACGVDLPLLILEKIVENLEYLDTKNLSKLLLPSR